MPVVCRERIEEEAAEEKRRGFCGVSEEKKKSVGEDPWLFVPKKRKKTEGRGLDGKEKKRRPLL